MIESLCVQVEVFVFGFAFVCVSCCLDVYVCAMFVAGANRVFGLYRRKK